MPEEVPGAAVSPGARICNFTNVPELTVTAELVFAPFEPSVVSVAVAVELPPVLSVTLKLLVPATSAALMGRTALASLDVIATVSVTVLIGFQLASTALTVILKAVPAVCAVGVPVLPDALPGAAVWPGSKTCSLAKAAALTVMDGLVLEVMPVCVASEAVMVALPAVLSVTLRLFVPFTRLALAGKVALASLDVMAIVSFVLTRFQLASTALTVTLKAVPAVCPVGVPVLPLDVPGAAVSPGANNCSFTNAPAFTWIAGLV